MSQPLRDDPGLDAGPDSGPAPTKADEVAAAVAAAPGGRPCPADVSVVSAPTGRAAASPAWSSATAISRV